MSPIREASLAFFRKFLGAQNYCVTGLIQGLFISAKSTQTDLFYVLCFKKRLLIVLILQPV